MRDPRLAPFTAYELMDELRSRFQELAGQQIVTMQTQLPPPATKQIILAGPPEEKLPKGIVKAEPIPGRFNPDGSPRRLLTSGVPKELQERLTVTPQSLQGRDEFDGKTQFIVKGSEREILANAMIQSWKEEIEELENQLAQVENQDARDAIESDIARLRHQIALRSDSAFGGMTAEEARARNLADNGNVQDAPSEAAVPGRGVRFTMASGIPEWDDPQIVETPNLGMSVPGAQILARNINEDPICGHIRPAIPGVAAFNDFVTLKIVAEPSVIYRLAHHWERACVTEKRDPMPLYDALAEITKDHAVHFRTNSDNYRGAWTSYLKARYARSALNLSGDPEGMSFKRAIRILNPDFQEMEVPDSFYEQTDGANPYGQQRRPHVNVRDSWDTTEQGPGVFKMSRRMPPPLSMDPANVSLEEDL